MWKEIFVSNSPKGFIERDLFNQNSDWSSRKSFEKAGPPVSKRFRLDRTDPLSFRPKFPEILDKWNLSISFSRNGKSCNLVVGPSKARKIKVLFDRLVTADDKARTM